MKKLISFNNKVSAFIETSTLPRGISENELFKLNGKYVKYYISTNNSVPYIGVTSDLGERINTHVKCARSLDSKLYEDIRRNGACTFGIIGIYDTKEEARKNESEHIMSIKMRALEDHYGKKLPLIDDDERNLFLLKKMYNINE